MVVFPPVTSGTNSGDVTIGTANGLSLSAQILSMAAAGAGVAGAMTTGAQTLDGAKTFSSVLSSSVVSGSVAVHLLTGSKLGLDTSDATYFSSDGTTVTLTAQGLTAPTLTTTGTNNFQGASLQLSSVLSTLYFSSTAAGGGVITSGISAANASTTVPAIKIYPQNALDATDLVVAVQNAVGAANLFSVNYSGLAKTSGNFDSATGFAVNGTQIVFLGNAVSGSADSRGACANNGSAVANAFGNFPALTASGAQIAAFYSDSFTTKVASIDKDGRLNFQATDSTGTPGAAVINKPAGQVAIASGASSVVVTNSLVTSASIVLVVIQTTDAVLTGIKSVIPGAGSFTITGNGVAAGNVNVGFVVHN